MDLREALIGHIGKTGDGKDMLMQAICLLLIYQLTNKEKNGEEKKEEDTTEEKEEYGINDAFKDTFERNNKFPTQTPQMIPRPT